MIFRRKINDYIVNNNCNIKNISDNTQVPLDRLTSYLEGKIDLNIKEVEDLVEFLGFDLIKEQGGYVSQGGAKNINIQIVNFGNDSEKFISAISDLIAKNTPFKD